MWPCSPSGGTTWQWLLDNLYNNATFSPLVYRMNGKMVVFVPYSGAHCYDEATVAAIESNGGRDNVVVVPMWALFGQSTYTQGVYGFFSPCTSPDGQYTTSMVGVGSCDQFPTTSSGTVVEVSASGSYMVSQSALPMASPGHLRGLTLARLFERVLTYRAPHLFMSSFNEWIGGRQAPASSAKIAFNQGLPTDPQRLAVWVDTYGAEFSRDVEPSVEAGDAVWNVTVSCVQLYKRNLTCADVDAATVPCCSRADKEVRAL